MTGTLYIATDTDAYDRHKQRQRRVVLADEFSEGSTPPAGRVVVCGAETADAYELARSRYPSDVSVVREADLKPLTVRTLDQVEPQPTRWVWEGVVPLSELTVWVGDPSAGKTFAAIDLAARIPSGRGMPDGSPGPGAGCALFLTFDDTIETTVYGRCVAAGADMSRLIVVDGNMAGEGEAKRVTSGDIEALLIAAEDAERASGVPLRLIVVDPMSALLAGTDANQANQLYDRLTPLVGHCRRHNVALLVLAHTSKAVASKAINLITGSQAQAGLSRSVWLVTAGDEDERLFLPVKSSLTQMRDGLMYTVDDRPIEQLVDDATANGLAAKLGRTDLPVVRWLGDSNMTAQEWIDDAGGDSGATKAKDAVRVTMTCLRQGVRDATAIIRAGEAEGLSKSTMQHATNGYGFIKTKASIGWLWGWPDEKRDDVIQAHFASTA